MNLGLKEVVSEEPHPKHEPQPHANTWTNKNKHKLSLVLCLWTHFYFIIHLDRIQMHHLLVEDSNGKNEGAPSK